MSKKKTEEQIILEQELERVARRSDHESKKDRRITRQRRELRRLNAAYLAQRGRADRMTEKLHSELRERDRLRKLVNNLYEGNSKLLLAVDHGRDALKPKARAKFDDEYFRILEGGER